MTPLIASEASTFSLGRGTPAVAWHPWGEAAFALARRENKPVLLSIGYAACHWCHEMARESFADGRTAALLNEGFVCIRADREERPDLDLVYQQAHQLLRRGAGGWPLTAFLSPAGAPFYSGTYFPAEAQGGQPAFRDLLATVSTVWSDRHDALARQDEALLEAFAASLPVADARVVLDATTRDAACVQLGAAFDEVNGGFGAAPKFPHPTDLAFLLQRGRDEGDAAALHMALSSMRKMAAGGLYDQVGGGFFRHSVDARWRVPHFEKMLCDNGVLLALYADALVTADEPLLRRVVEDTAAWALREMRAESGGFHAALAADDGLGREGHAYLWESEPLRLALSPDEWDVCAAHWGLVDAPEFEGRWWHLRIARTAAELATMLGRPQAMVEALIATARAKLLAARDKRDVRERPVRDDKQITAWNALMITGLARAAAVCARSDWLQAARAALAFLKRERWTAGRLATVPAQDGFLDDHAFLLEAVLALHQADPQDDDLPFARQLADALLVRFEDAVAGGFWFTPHDAPPLIHRPKTGLDAATPSGNGTAARALQALGRLVDEPRYFAAAERCVTVFARIVRSDPASHTRLLQAALSA